MTKYVDCIRSSFVTVNKGKGMVSCSLPTIDKSYKVVDVLIRDTMILAPATKHKLSDLGELVGINKLELHDDPDTAKFYIENMNEYLIDYPDKFEEYGIRDAYICVKYLQEVMARFEIETGIEKVPLTLSGIGVDILIELWKKDNKNYNYILGKEIHPFHSYNQKQERTIVYKKPCWLPEVFHENDFVTECFHGGRNEQFWYGIGFEDNWYDLDLANAYPTSMSMIKTPIWKEAEPFGKGKCSIDDLLQDDYQSLAYAWIEFKFPHDTRYPSLPVRTNNGIIFPLEGTTYCASPELLIAKTLGCDITIKRAVKIPTEPDEYVFENFIKHCIDQRNTYSKGTLDNLFWKELVNSTYGKTAQGLREKRLYDLRSGDMKVLSPSVITNPFYASYITSFVRAILACVMNSIPNNKMIFSVTTDGFLGNVSIDDIKSYCWDKPIMQLVRNKRLKLVDKEDVLEVKHHIRKPLGWKTRGQATLIKGTKENLIDGAKDLVLAKSGIKTNISYDDDENETKEIIKHYFKRKYDTTLEQGRGIGPKHMVVYHLDFTKYTVEKGLNMEYDWKRIPFSAIDSKDVDYKSAPIAFNTKPLLNKSQFEDIRELAYKFKITKYANEIQEDKDNDRKRFYCFTIKSKANLDEFLDYVKHNQRGKQKIYQFREGNEVKRLRTEICSAFKRRKAGLNSNDTYIELHTTATQSLEMQSRMYYALMQKGLPPDIASRRVIKVSNVRFAKYLNFIDNTFECKPYHVNNGVKIPFIPNRIPPTRWVIDILHRIKAFGFPDLDIEMFLDRSLEHKPLSIELKEDYFTQLVK